MKRVMSIATGNSGAGARRAPDDSEVCRLRGPRSSRAGADFRELACARGEG